MFLILGILEIFLNVIMIFIKAFVVGGIICAIGQLILDYFKLTPAHITCSFVVVGAALDVFGLYDKLLKISK